MHKIKILNIHDSPGDWENFLAIVKDFDVEELYVNCPIANDMLRTFFQLKLKLFRYTGPVPLDIMLEMEISIPEMIFTRRISISTDDLMHIVSKIQSGSLSTLTFVGNAIDWSVFDVLPFDHDGPLLDTRPLLLKRHPYSKKYYAYDPLDTNCEYWLLNPYGGIVVCRMEYSWLTLSPCERWEYPWILRREEDILKDLAEKRPNVSCSESQFHTFSSSFTTIDCYHEGPLPEIRPLSCKVSEYEFWLLDDEDNFMNCALENGCALWRTFQKKFGKVEHPALAKYIFWKFVKQEERSEDDNLRCSEQEFDSWFDDYEELDLQYSGPLPSTRPLVFDGRANYKCVRVVLLEDRLVECTLGPSNYVKIKPCTWSNRPFIFFSVKHVVEMLRDRERKNDLSPILLRDMIYEKTATEFWFIMDRGIGKVDWKGGYVRLANGNNFRGSSSNFMKQAFRRLAENEPRNSKEYFNLDLKSFESCLDQFTVLPFDYSGPLPTDSPLVFVKHSIGHDALCRATNRCTCSTSALLVWFLWNGRRVTYCSWNKQAWEDVFFGKSTYFNDLPPALKSKEYLKNLLLGKYEDSFKYDWFGGFDDFLACVNGYVKLPFDYTARLPSGRPLVFDCGPSGDHPSFLILREDGTIIQCVKTASHISMSLSSNKEDVPPALKTKNYLKHLIQSKYDSSSSCDWFGHFDDFLACLNEYVKLPFDYDARLPNERPLVFDSRSDDKDPIYFILREDDTIIQCLKHTSHISLSLFSNYEFVPPVLKSLL